MYDPYNEYLSNNVIVTTVTVSPYALLSICSRTRTLYKYLYTHVDMHNSNKGNFGTLSKPGIFIECPCMYIQL